MIPKLETPDLLGLRWWEDRNTLVWVRSPVITDDTDVRNRKPSAILDLAGNLSATTGTPLSGFGRPHIGIIHSLHIGLRV